MKNTIRSMLILLLFSSLQVSGQPSLFTGEWKLNRVKTAPQETMVTLTQIKVQLTSDTLLTLRTYETGSGEVYPFVENISLDGKDCKIVVYDMPRSSKASYSPQDGLIKVESVTTYYGNNGEDNNKTSETWKTEEGGKTLTIVYTTTTAMGSVSGTQYFDRIN